MSLAAAALPWTFAEQHALGDKDVRHFLSAITVLIAIACVAIADETSGPIDRKLAEAKAQYSQSTDAARDELNKQIEKAISAAQSAGDLKTLDTINSQKKAFVDNGTLPTKVPTKQYLSALDSSRSKMAAAFTNAVKDYTKAGHLDLARETQLQLDEFSKLSAKRPQGSAALKPTFPTGQWVSLFPKTDQLSSWDMENTNYKYKQGVLELQNCVATFPLDAKNVAVRVTAKKLSGQNLAINLRASEKGGYAFIFNGRNEFVIGKSKVPGGWQDLKVANTRESYNDFVTLTFVAVGPELRAFVNTELVLQVHDEDHAQGKIGINAFRGASLFRDYSVQVLKSDTKLNEYPK